MVREDDFFTDNKISFETLGSMTEFPVDCKILLSADIAFGIWPPQNLPPSEHQHSNILRRS